MKYWLGVVSKEHVLKGKSENIAQVCHGKKEPLGKLKKGDWLIYYSPGEIMGCSNLQAFTAVGIVADDHIYQFKMSENSKDVLISQIKTQLGFTQNKNWGYNLRRGLVELTKDDFFIITTAMGIIIE